MFSDERKELPNGRVKYIVCFPVGLSSKRKQIDCSEGSGSGYRKETEQRWEVGKGWGWLFL